jgi:hypothetical protein
MLTTLPLTPTTRQPAPRFYPTFRVFCARAQPGIKPLPALLASLEALSADRPTARCRHAIQARSSQIRVKSAQNCAPFAPNTSADAHNSIEFVPTCSSKTLQNTTLPRTPAKLSPRISLRNRRFSSAHKNKIQSAKCQPELPARLPRTTDYRPEINCRPVSSCHRIALGRRLPAFRSLAFRRTHAARTQVSTEE